MDINKCYFCKSDILFKYKPIVNVKQRSTTKYLLHDCDLIEISRFYDETFVFSMKTAKLRGTGCSSNFSLEGNYCRLYIFEYLDPVKYASIGINDPTDFNLCQNLFIDFIENQHLI